jgi:hypothetical protein
MVNLLTGLGKRSDGGTYSLGVGVQLLGRAPRHVHLGEELRLCDCLRHGFVTPSEKLPAGPPRETRTTSERCPQTVNFNVCVFAPDQSPIARVFAIRGEQRKSLWALSRERALQ